MNTNRYPDLCYCAIVPAVSRERTGHEREAQSCGLAWGRRREKSGTGCIALGLAGEEKDPRER